MKVVICCWWSVIVLCSIVFCNEVYAGGGSPVVKALKGSEGSLHVDSVVMVEDAVFFSAAKSKLLLPYAVRSRVTFGIDEESKWFLQGAFTASVRLHITTTDVGSVEHVMDTTLTINYDSAGTYLSRMSYVIRDAYRVEVKVTQMNDDVSWDVWKALKVETELGSDRQFTFEGTGIIVPSVSGESLTSSTDKDQISVSWPTVIEADEYDLEWAYVDTASFNAGRYSGTTGPDPALIFKNNASRVSITGTTYKIPLLYDDNGILFYRVRAVQVLGSLRKEAAWSSGSGTGLGRFDYDGHERGLNWQATTTYAEEGKRKSVVQYYDGSLRNRQTVTRDNTRDTTIIAESFYDYQGRPVIQVLPSPSLSTIIKYTKNFTVTASDSAEYTKEKFDLLTSASMYCNTSAPEMGRSSGAAQYYSGRNPDKDKWYNQFIPDAKGYPFTQTEYTPDNTGRISRQSGVGPTYRLGSSRETKYFYGTPDQSELDALFGTEAGDQSHYFKTMVRDANGQYSVSYTDMHGRTIATALAGTLPDSVRMDSLSSRNVKQRVETLSNPRSVVIHDLEMESSKGLMVPFGGWHDFHYGLKAPELKIKGCNGDTVSYPSLYDLEITITDDCNNQKVPDSLRRMRFSNFTAIPQSGTRSFNQSFSVYLQEGSYDISKRLVVNREALAYYRDSVFMQVNTCRTLDSFLVEQRQKLAAGGNCSVSCESCTASLGTLNEFRARYYEKAGVSGPDTLAYADEARQAYEQAEADCDLLCKKPSEDMELRTKMLLDMSAPSGQYANLDSERVKIDTLSIFGTRKVGNLDVMRYATIDTYKDAEGNPDLVYDDRIGELVNPNRLSPEEFSAKFKPSWAESLLILHPEYKKLAKYESLSESNEWDRQFEAVETYAEALGKGYLNPIGSTTSFPNGSVVHDPLLNENSTVFTQLNAALTNYRSSGQSMWQVATRTVSQTAGAFDTTVLCAGDRDMAWKSFRQFYLGVKADIVQDILSAYCVGCQTPDQLRAANHQPNFGSATNVLQASGLGGLLTVSGDGSAEKAGMDAQITAQYAANCQAYVGAWIEKLRDCYTPTEIDTITAELLKVCSGGSDARHPFGASTVKPGTTSGYKSFEEVMKHYAAAYGKSYASCNGYGFEAPATYESQVLTSETRLTRPDSCQCANVTALYKQYQGYKRVGEDFSGFVSRTKGTVMSNEDLYRLKDLCSARASTSCSFEVAPVVIPAFLQCGVRDVCVTCERVDSVYKQYEAEFSDMLPVRDTGSNDLDSNQIRNNELFKNYMNYQLGFTKQAAEYLEFLDSCPKATLPDSVKTALNNLLTNYKYVYKPGEMHYAFLPTGAGMEQAIIDPKLIIGNGVARLPDNYRLDSAKFYTTMHAGFGDSRLCFMDEGYSVEWRLKMPVWNVYNKNYLFVESIYLAALFSDGKEGQSVSDGTYLASYNDFDFNHQGHENGGTGFDYIKVDTAHAFDKFQRIKLRYSRSNFQVYYNDTLVRSVPKQDSSIYNWFLNANASFLGNDGAVDWLKIYDKNDSLRIYEDFSDSLNPRSVETSQICPAPPDCETAFANYYNTQRGTNYTFGQIDSIYYRNLKKSLDVCTLNPVAIGPRLCGKSEPLFPQVALEQITSCSDSTYFIQGVAQERQRAYRDSLLNVFELLYRSKSMEAARVDTFTVSHEASEYHYTLYYYDQAGNLVKTVSPEGVNVSKFDDAINWSNQVAAARKNNEQLTPDHTLGTNYRYNTLNQVVAQSTPDAGVSQFWYDRLGRLVVSQNAKQQAAGTTEQYKQYSYTKYDGIGRITEVGELSNGTLTAITDSISRKEALLASWLSSSDSLRRQITKTVYDTAYDPYQQSGLAPIVQRNLRNRVSYTSIATGNNPAQFNQASFFSYDIHGNVDTLLQDYGMSGFTSTANVMNTMTGGEKNNRFKKMVYQYDLISGKVNHVAYQSGSADQFYHRYSYDAENRLISAETSMDSVIWEKDARYSYYPHGPLARVVLGDQQVQGIDYAYTLQGWLKGVNSTSLNASADMGEDGATNSSNRNVARDAFAFNLNYFTGDYYAISDKIPFPGYSSRFDSANRYKPLYNGNISSMAVSVKKIGNPLFYNYTYDQLNRLTQMDTYTGLNESMNRYDTLLAQNAYKERVAYDANGNILKYLRNGSSANVQMDSLSYKYQVDGSGKLLNNRLQYVRDSVQSGAYAVDLDNEPQDNYSYDQIGNLIKDSSERIRNITWSVYGKILEIEKSDTGKGAINNIQYSYDASGNRISKRIKRAGSDSLEYTWYVRDASGNVMALYESKGKDTTGYANYSLTLREQHLYGSSRLGIVNRQLDLRKDSTTTSQIRKFVRGNKLFELSNHLGNVLSTISDKKLGVSGGSDTVSYYNAEVMSAQEYYPFGMLMPGRGGHAGRAGVVADETGTKVVEANPVMTQLRTTSSPSVYLGLESVVFEPGFGSIIGDYFTTITGDSARTFISGGTISASNPWIANSSDGSRAYRYGFNGQEISDEIKGHDNSYTAEFWEYDPRAGRRWNLDPRPSIGVSPYSAFNDNPIFFNDLLGDTIKIYGSAEASNTTLNEKGGTADLGGNAINIKDARIVPAVDPKNNNKVIGYNVFDTKNTDRNMPVMQIEADDIEAFKKGYDLLMTGARLYYANGEPSEGMKKYVAAFDFNAGKINWGLAWNGIKQQNKEAWSDPSFRAQLVLSFINMGLGFVESNPASNPVSNARYKPGSSAERKTMNGSDVSHKWPAIVKNYASGATKFTITGADKVERTLYQIEGSLNGKDGRFEWILEKGQITHQQFISGGTINGIPIKP